MPQLNPSPWLLVAFSIWMCLPIMMFSIHCFLPMVFKTNLLLANDMKPNSWNWPW
nr:ATP synthase F0 subunit 8 [Eptatretus carlhubbsi]